MRCRFQNPTPPKRMMRNMLAGGFSDVSTHIQMPPIGALASDEVALSRLARYVRNLTDSVTQERVEATLEYIDTLKDQQSVGFNLVSKPPMSFFVTDHRPADVAGYDFGFGCPIAHRFLTGGCVSPNMILVYPAARNGRDDGSIWSITVEKDIVPELLQNEEWCKYFEYRGVD